MGAIPDAIKHNFDVLLRAAANGDLAVISCTDTKSGEPRWVIAAVSLNRGEANITPIGHMATGNPYEDYKPCLDATPGTVQ